MTRPTVKLRPEIVAQTAYRQGRPAAATDFKLSSNELPFPPLPAVVEAVAAADAYHRYPDATARRLREAIAERFDVSPDQVLIGSGSVALLYQAALAAAGSGDEIVYPWRSFEAYPGMVALTGATGVQVPLRDDGSLDLDAMADAITDRTRLVIVCTPNNPTGPVVGHGELEGFLDRVPDDVLVVIDEAYTEFVTDRRAADGSRLLAEHANVVVARTFSKAYGLAALRVGYLVGRAENIAALHPAGIPLSVTAQAEAAALAALGEVDEIGRRIAEITVRRDEIARALADQGWRLPVSQANFVWLPTGAHTGEAEQTFRDHGLVVRAFAGDGVRVSIGEDGAVGPILKSAAAILARFPELKHTKESVER